MSSSFLAMIAPRPFTFAFFLVSASFDLATVVEPSPHVAFQLVLLGRLAHFTEIDITDTAGHGRITGLHGVPDLGAVPALQDFALLAECPHFGIALHPLMTPEFCSNVGHKTQNGSPVSKETNEPFQEQIVWMRLNLVFRLLA